MPERPYSTRQYARVENELKYFVDEVIKNPRKNFGLDTIMELKNVNIVSFNPKNMRQFPAVVIKQTSISPERGAWGKIEKINEETGEAYTGALYRITFEIHCIIEKNAAIVYNGIKYQGADNNYDEISTLDVFKSIFTWILTKNYNYCNPVNDWGWNNIDILSIDYLRGYDGKKNLYGVRFRCSIQWEWDVPYSEIGNF